MINMKGTEWGEKEFSQTCTNKNCRCHKHQNDDMNYHCCIDCIGDEYYEN